MERERRGKGACLEPHSLGRVGEAREDGEEIHHGGVTEWQGRFCLGGWRYPKRDRDAS